MFDQLQCEIMSGINRKELVLVEFSCSCSLRGYVGSSAAAKLIECLFFKRCF